jgi:hypothetical protein
MKKPANPHHSTACANMPTRSVQTLIPALLMTLAIVTPASAQVSPGLPVSGAVQGYVQSWRVDEGTVSKDVTQMVVPVGLFVPLSPGVELRMASSYVTLSRQFTDSNEKETVSGLSDLKVQLNTGLLRNRLHLGVVANVPTGHAGLTGQEQDVVLSFIAPDLSVRANRFSEGFNIGTTVSFAIEMGSSTIATIGGAFVSRGKYDFTFPGLSDAVDLNPGFEATGTASVLHVMGGSSLRAVAGYSHYGMEKIDGADAFRLGPRVFGELHYALPFEDGRGRISFGIQDMYRLPHTSGDALDLNGMMDSDGNYLITLGGVDYSVTPWLGLSLDGTGRFIGQNGDGVGDARVIDGGLAAIFSPTVHLDITVGGRFVVGSGTGLSGEERNIQGVEGLLRLSTRL